MKIPPASVSMRILASFAALGFLPIEATQAGEQNVHTAAAAVNGSLFPSVDAERFGWPVTG